MSRLALRLSVGAVALTLGAGAAPALASSTPRSGDPTRAATRLTAKITQETSMINDAYQLTGGVDGDLADNAYASGNAAYEVSRVGADSAQLAAKEEWMLGAYLQARGDNSLGYGQHEQVYDDPASAKRAIDAALGDFRVSNYLIDQADSDLGIRHPAATAQPYRPYRDQPAPNTAPLISRGPGSSLTSTIAFATPLLAETIPSQIAASYVNLSEAASGFYQLAVAGLHVQATQRPAELEWVAGVRTLQSGEQQLVRYDLRGSAFRRQDAEAFSTLRRGDAEIAQADTQLGIHASGPTVRLPSKVEYFS